MSEKKKLQLGMNPSTASARLVKDTLWKLIEQTSQDGCYRCGEKMTRETFSIEHIKPWLDSDNPVEMYFDQGNISFSHLSCNIKDARKAKVTKFCGTAQSYKRGCRCKDCKEAKSSYEKGNYCPKKRRERYKSTGN